MHHFEKRREGRGREGVGLPEQGHFVLDQIAPEFNSDETNGQPVERE